LKNPTRYVNQENIGFGGVSQLDLYLYVP